MRVTRRGALVVGLAVAAVVALTGCDWPMLRGNPQGTSSNPASGITTSNVATLGIRWAATAPVGTELVESRGIVVDRNVAYNAPDGSVRWTSGAITGPDAAIDGDTVYGTAAAGELGTYTLSALSLETGAVRWTSSRFGDPTETVVSNGRIYVTTGGARGASATIDVYDVASHQFVRSQVFYPSVGSPTFANGTEFVTGDFDGTPGNDVGAFDAASGTPKWTAHASACPLVHTTPAVANGRVYASGATFDASTGAFLFDWPVCPQSDPVVAGNTVFIVTQPQAGAWSLVAFDATTGAARWTKALGPPAQFGSIGIVAGDDVVYASNGKALTGFSAATGAKVWTPTPVANISAPIVADGSLYVTTFNALVAYRPTS